MSPTPPAALPAHDPDGADPLAPRSIVLHGHRVTYRAGGDLSGKRPVLLLLHGITSSSASWAPVLPALSASYGVIAPDLLGHGTSAKPRGDYSLGAYASGARDLLSALGVDRVTTVGHSLGGGVALQFAYQFPQRTERLVLVASGGLGREVSPFLRAATLPLAEYVLPVIASPSVLRVGTWIGRGLQLLALRPPPSMAEMLRGYASLAETGARQAFVHTARGVIDAGGQRVDARDRLYLAAGVPTLLIWGARDQIIPVGHGRRAHELTPGSELEVFEAAGHFPQADEPERFARVLGDWVARTAPGQYDEEDMRARLRRGA